MMLPLVGMGGKRTQVVDVRWGWKGKGGREYGRVGMKDREAILQSRLLRPFAHLFGHPSLWHLNRRSVPRALAIGLFAAFIVPLGQIALAALLAIPLRANVPLAAGATFVSNPITFPAIYIGAYKFGSFLLHHSTSGGTDQLARSLGWKLLDVSAPTALGLLIFATVSAIAGFAVGCAWWRVRLRRRWRLSRENVLRSQRTLI